MPLLSVHNLPDPDEYDLDRQLETGIAPDELFGRAARHPRAPRRQTLDPTQIIPAGVARRLARIYSGIDPAAAARGQRPALTQAEFALQRETGRLDGHAAMADCCALIDYRETHGHPGAGPESPDVVPWAYRRYRGRANPDTIGVDGSVEAKPTLVSEGL